MSKIKVNNEKLAEHQAQVAEQMIKQLAEGQIDNVTVAMGLAMLATSVAHLTNFVAEKEGGNVSEDAQKNFDRNAKMAKQYLDSIESGQLWLPYGKSTLAKVFDQFLSMVSRLGAVVNPPKE